MASAPANFTTSGPAFRVTIVGPQMSEAYEQVFAHIDAAAGVVHVLSADNQTHYLSIPLSHALIEWRDPSALQPVPRVPPFGPGAFERMGEQLGQFMGQMGHGFGPGS